MKPLLHVGIDVDDKAFTIVSYNVLRDEYLGEQTKPVFESLIKALSRLGREHELKVCYEATYLGFSLHRRLTTAGYDCTVVAPSLIPKTPGDQVKTDQLDARKLARLFAAGMLTSVYVPSEADESYRRLMRSRKFVAQTASTLKIRINSLSRSVGWNYKQETNRSQTWTKLHERWLRDKVKDHPDVILRIDFELLLNQLEMLQATLESYENQIQKLASQAPFKEKAEALMSFRSIGLITAMTLITEIGDARRFPHPKHLCSFAGFDVREYSSGGKERKFGITKLGNRHIRTALVEAAQFSLKPPRISRELRKRRELASGSSIAIADRCMQRLYTKGSRMLHRGKHRNVVKVACAREMIGFVWAALKDNQQKNEENGAFLEE